MAPKNVKVPKSKSVPPPLALSVRRQYNTRTSPAKYEDNPYAGKDFEFVNERMHSQYRNESAGVICIKDLDLNMIKKDLEWLGALKKGDVIDDEELGCCNMWMTKIKVARGRLQETDISPVIETVNPYEILSYSDIEVILTKKYPDLKPTRYPMILLIENFNVRAAIRDIDWLGQLHAGDRDDDPYHKGVIRWKKQLKDAISRKEKEGEESEGEIV